MTFPSYKGLGLSAIIILILLIIIITIIPF